MNQITPGMMLAPLLIAGALFSAAAPAQDSRLLATINGKPLTEADLVSYISLHAPQTDPGDSQMVGYMFEGLVGRELAYQEAVRLKVDQNPGLQARIEEQRRTMVVQAMMEQHFNENPVTESDARAAYEELVSANKADEYHTRHILLDSSEDAAPALAALKKGKSFEAVAKKYSTDFSADNGGDMGWLTAANMEPAYGEAVKNLKAGQYTQEAVETEFGWHIIKLEAVKAVPPPAFEMVADQIMSSLQQQRVEQFLTELRQKADIKVEQ